MKPLRLAVSLGDPRGIGPEIVSASLADPRVGALGAAWLVVGPTGTGVAVDDVVGAWSPSGDRVRDAASAGRLAGMAVERAARLALSGVVQGIVTAPLDKAALHAGGYDYPGHTEMLAAIAGVPTTMMLASDRLRVVLATTHIALRDVVHAVAHDAIVNAAAATRKGLQEGFGIASPRIALCALNPHVATEAASAMRTSGCCVRRPKRPALRARFPRTPCSCVRCVVSSMQ